MPLVSANERPSFALAATWSAAYSVNSMILTASPHAPGYRLHSYRERRNTVSNQNPGQNPNPGQKQNPGQMPNPGTRQDPKPGHRADEPRRDPSDRTSKDKDRGTGAGQKDEDNS